MTVQEFRERMADPMTIGGGSELHLAFHQFSQEALRITAEITARTTRRSSCKPY